MPIELSHTGADFFRGNDQLATGRYGLSVKGQTPADCADFSISINGDPCYESPINLISGPHSPGSTQDGVGIPDTREARITVGGGGVTRWTPRLGLGGPG